MNHGWFAVHARDKIKRNWRLRDMIRHPIDPCWERGEYLVCHENLRNQALVGDIVFDLVYPGSIINNPTVIRSAFIITDITKQKSSTKYMGSFLSFSEFFYSDGKPINSKSFRNYEKISWKEAKDLLNTIEKNREYKRYPSGEKPMSISDESWTKMKKIAIKSLIKSNFI